MYHVVCAVPEAADRRRTTREVEDGKGNREKDEKDLEELQCVLAT
jgi:hypothetical protein